MDLPPFFHSKIHDDNKTLTLPCCNARKGPPPTPRDLELGGRWCDIKSVSYPACTFTHTSWVRSVKLGTACCVLVQLPVTLKAACTSSFRPSLRPHTLVDSGLMHCCLLPASPTALPVTQPALTIFAKRFAPV